MLTPPFIKRIFRKPPAIFPWLALFQVLMTIHAIWVLIPTPLNQRDWLRPLSMLLFTITWLFVCDMKRWAALVYIGLTTLCIFLRLFMAFDSAGAIFGDAFFPTDILMTFFIMFFFKKFE